MQKKLKPIIKLISVKLFQSVKVSGLGGKEKTFVDSLDDKHLEITLHANQGLIFIHDTLKNDTVITGVNNLCWMRPVMSELEDESEATEVEESITTEEAPKKYNFSKKKV